MAMQLIIENKEDSNQILSNTVCDKLLREDTANALDSREAKDFLKALKRNSMPVYQRLLKWYEKNKIPSISNTSTPMTLEQLVQQNLVTMYYSEKEAEVTKAYQNGKRIFEYGLLSNGRVLKFNLRGELTQSISSRYKMTPLDDVRLIGRGIFIGFDPKDGDDNRDNRKTQ